MTKVYYIDRYRGSILSKALIADGVLLEFGSGGRFVREGPMDYNSGLPVEVDALSIVAQNGCIEVATNVQGIFTKTELGSTPLELMNKISTVVPGLLFKGIRPGVTDGLSYTQYIFIFAKGSLTSQVLKGVIG